MKSKINLIKYITAFKQKKSNETKKKKKNSFFYQVFYRKLETQANNNIFQLFPNGEIPNFQHKSHSSLS